MNTPRTHQDMVLAFIRAWGSIHVWEEDDESGRYLNTPQSCWPDGIDDTAILHVLDRLEADGDLTCHYERDGYLYHWEYSLPHKQRSGFKSEGSAQPPTVFISHATVDRRFVEDHLLTPMQHAGIGTWYCERDIPTAEEWERAIFASLKTCEWFLVVVSPASVRSKWVRREVSFAFDERDGRIIPAVIETCEQRELHIGLPLLQHADFRTDVQRGLKQVMSLLQSANAPEDR